VCTIHAHTSANIYKQNNKNIGITQSLSATGIYFNNNNASVTLTARFRVAMTIRRIVIIDNIIDNCLVALTNIIIIFGHIDHTVQVYDNNKNNLSLCVYQTGTRKIVRYEKATTREQKTEKTIICGGYYKGVGRKQLNDKQF